MTEAIDAPDEMSPYAPRIITIKIPVDKIGEVIGPKGKMINQIQDETGAEITIEDDGTIYIGATDGPTAEAARAMINAIANPTMPEVGERYLGTVVKTTTFGAFVSLMPGKDGLLHISQLRKLAGGKRVENVEDVVKVGDKVQVEIAEIDPRGKLSLIPVVEGGERLPSRSAPADEPADADADGSTAWPRSRRPARPARCSRRPTAADSSAAPSSPAGCGSSPRRCPTVRSVTFGIWVGVGSRDETPVAGRRVALPRAPALQGHPAPRRAGHLRRRSTPSAAR